MKKLFYSLVLVFIFVATVTAAKAASENDKKYINGIDANYPPFAFIDEKTGEPSGFDVDSMTWIANKMGFEVEHRPIAWDGIISALIVGKIDMICSGMSVSPERSRVVDFTEPYWEVSRVIITDKDSKLTYNDIFSKEIKFGVQRGTSEATAMAKEQKEKNYPFELRYYESAPLIVEDLLIGRIDAAIMDALPAEDSISKGKKVKVIATHGKKDIFGVAIQKDNKKLESIINEGYKYLKADPYWEELKAKYLEKK